MIWLLLGLGFGLWLVALAMYAAIDRAFDRKLDDEAKP